MIIKKGTEILVTNDSDANDFLKGYKGIVTQDCDSSHLMARFPHNPKCHPWATFHILGDWYEIVHKNFNALVNNE